ncbi:MAG TPA: GSU2204 family outer membrane beta-barrel protein, partial [Pelovirga sp.]|nr:GSU2204 family outer membrane beta-barrel protein [Pelovirga sp.]
EYNSDVHTLALNMDYQATEKLQLNAGVTYNKAEDKWDWGTFVERQTLVREDDPTIDLNESPAGPGQYAPVNYDTWEQNNLIDSYSDLSYEQYQFTVGGLYDFTETFFTRASFTYDIFDMKETYVYGDEDGTAYYGYVGFGWTF